MGAASGGADGDALVPERHQELTYIVLCRDKKEGVVEQPVVIGIRGDVIELLKNPNSGVQIAFVFGGFSDGEPVPGVLSLGTAYTNPFWIFYSSDEPLDRLSQLKGGHYPRQPLFAYYRFFNHQ